jgi:cell division protease FtsH
MWKLEPSLARGIEGRLLLGLSLALLLSACGSFPDRVAPEERVEVPYSQFKQLLVDGALSEVTLQGADVRATLRQAVPLGDPPRSAAALRTRIPPMGDAALLALLEEGGVAIRVEAESSDDWRSSLFSLVMWLLVLAVFYFSGWRATRAMGGLGGGALQSFLRDGSRRAESHDVTFADVAGQEHAKRDVQELVDYLREPEHFRKLGAEVPRGVLLMGPPGTGKTLLARALAGEAGVPFFSISASQFIEMFVGVGASRVRSLFAQARREAPCIVFIDELDAVGRTRGAGFGGGHDEREQTLNQILSELDGFERHEPVIVLGATNRPDVLDPALLRPGRFDRQVTLDLPDRKDRAALLAVHTRRVPLASDVDLERMAATTPGFSGADLKNLVNEAAILAAREKLDQVHARHLEEALDKLVLGAARSMVIGAEERHRLAVHEAGHAVVAHFLPQADPVHKVSIIPRGHALGGTQQLPEQERHTLPEPYLRARLAVLLGGRTAEREVLRSVSSGGDDDIRQATALARSMVARWGMSDEIGPVDLRDAEEHPFLGREMAVPRRFSDASAERVDRAVRDLLQGAEASANELLRQHGAALERMVEALEREEQIDREQIDALLGPRVLSASAVVALAS